jgi:hypothetical protein
MAIAWTTHLNSYPSQSWAFVLASDNPYALFLTCRIDQPGWRAFLIPNARSQRDLFGGEETRWSTDVFEEAGLTLREDQLVEAQAALVRILASRLGIDAKEIVPARNGRPVSEKRLTQAQMAQIARTQPRKR